MSLWVPYFWFVGRLGEWQFVVMLGRDCNEASLVYSIVISVLYCAHHVEVHVSQSHTETNINPFSSLLTSESWITLYALIFLLGKRSRLNPPDYLLSCLGDIYVLFLSWVLTVAQISFQLLGSSGSSLPSLPRNGGPQASTCHRELLINRPHFRTLIQSLWGWDQCIDSFKLQSTWKLGTQSS